MANFASNNRSGGRICSTTHQASRKRFKQSDISYNPKVYKKRHLALRFGNRSKQLWLRCRRAYSWSWYRWFGLGYGSPKHSIQFLWWHYNPCRQIILYRSTYQNLWLRRICRVNRFAQLSLAHTVGNFGYYTKLSYNGQYCRKRFDRTNAYNHTHSW